ncbi:pyridoxamine 5'-phosphate oxidase family protein [Gorillibacterium timonense]|uniref:pyridoxamine 5'-phosphate oxidase family protein n=1 Tax=Gorillibacterium timonense TaxID=1689269 RepID=UPI00292A4852|nr:pyridoxamine 5'-phosphate oxidase family protein [Gorillibacterium timonense]
MPMAEMPTVLSEHLFPLLQREKLVLLSTVDAEGGGPHTSAISWIFAPEPGRLRLAVDLKSSILANVKAEPQVTATFFGAGKVNVIYGTARVVHEPLSDLPLKLACIEVEIESVRDGLFHGSRITAEPEYEKTYDERAASKLDDQVFAALKKA